MSSKNRSRSSRENVPLRNHDDGNERAQGHSPRDHEDCRSSDYQAQPAHERLDRYRPIRLTI